LPLKKVRCAWREGECRIFPFGPVGNDEGAWMAEARQKIVVAITLKQQNKKLCLDISVAMLIRAHGT
jgi:hypothetical protein